MAQNTSDTHCLHIRFHTQFSFCSLTVINQENIIKQGNNIGAQYPVLSFVYDANLHK
jgi:hypothetical protein